jgi:hypothetical protein
MQKVVQMHGSIKVKLESTAIPCEAHRVNVPRHDVLLPLTVRYCMPDCRNYLISQASRSHTSAIRTYQDMHG